jgi:hypothetical protein
MKPILQSAIWLLILLLPCALFAQTSTWLGGPGNWNDASKWSSGIIPGVNDSVVITSGVVTLDNNTLIKYFKLNNATVTGTGNLTIAGNFDWSGTTGSVEGSGEINVTGLFNVSVNNWAPRLYGKKINMNGGGIWTDVVLELGQMAGFSLAAGKTLEINVTNFGIVFIGEAVRPFENHGTIVKNGRDMTFEPPIINYGSIESNSGEFYVGGSKHYNATVTVNPGANVTFGGTGGFTLPDETYFYHTQLGGEGRITFAGERTEFHDSSRVHVNAFEAWENDVILVDSTILQFECGSLLLNSPWMTVNTKNGFIVGEGGFNIGQEGKLLGTGNVTVLGNMRLGGEFFGASGEISLKGTLQVKGSFYATKANFNNTRLLLSGSATFEWPEIYLNNSEIIIDSGAGSAFNSYGFVKGSGKITNYGSMLIQTEYFDVRVPVNMYKAQVSVNGGATCTLYKGAVFRNTTIGTDVNAKVYFDSDSSGRVKYEFDSTNLWGYTGSGGVYFKGVHHADSVIFRNHSDIEMHDFFTSSATVIKSGCTFVNFNTQLRVDGSVFRPEIDLTVQNYNHVRGILAGGNNITVNGSMNWLGGTLAGTGLITVNDSFNIRSAAVTLDRQSIGTNGSGLWSGSLSMLRRGNILIAYGSRIAVNNMNILNADGNASSYLANYGSLIKEGTGVFATNVLLKNARNLVINAGTLDVNGQFLNLGSVRGYGTLDLQNGSMTNTGIFSPGVTAIGTLHVAGNYRNNVFNAEIKSNTGAVESRNDRLNVSGNIDIAGSSLIVKEIGAVASDSFVIMTCNGGPDCLDGSFASTDLPAGYSVVYRDSEVVVVKNAENILTFTQKASVQQAGPDLKVYRTAFKNYRIETTGQVQIVSMDGKIIKQMVVNGWAGLDMSEFAGGVYFVRNGRVGKTVKIWVE